METKQKNRITKLRTSKLVKSLDLTTTFDDAMAKIYTNPKTRVGEVFMALLINYVHGFKSEYDAEFWRVKFSNLDLWCVDAEDTLDGVHSIHYAPLMNVNSRGACLCVFRWVFEIGNARHNVKASGDKNATLEDVFYRYVCTLQETATNHLSGPHMSALVGLDKATYLCHHV